MQTMQIKMPAKPKRKSRRKFAFFIVFSGLVAILIALAVIFLSPKQGGIAKNVIDFTDNQVAAFQAVAVQVQVETVEMQPDTSKEITINFDFKTPPDLPPFAKLEGKTLKLTPGKYDVGVKNIVFSNSHLREINEMKYEIKVALTPIDTVALEKELFKVAGANIENIGWYVKDMLRGTEITHYPERHYKPGSISKLPVAFIVLKDLDSGKRKLTDTFPIYNKHKHSYYDNLGVLAQGTNVTIKRYLEELLKLSNNTAQYHLREMIGNPTQDPNIWSSGVLNERVKKELGVNEWGEDPHIATPNDVGKIWSQIYEGKVWSKEWTDFFLDTLGAAAPSLREGIAKGVPVGGTRVVNKVGFLYGGEDNTYGDSGLVYGKKTDYVIVIFNAKAPPFPQGATVIKNLSAVIYKYLDK